MPPSEEANATNRSSAKAKTVYCQEGAQGSTFNADIYGGVNTTYERGSSFSGSHNLSTVGRVITAGNNVHMPTTFQFYLNTSPLDANPHTISDISTSLQEGLESAHEFFRSPLNRDALVHPMSSGEPSASEVSAAASTAIRYSLESFGALQAHTDSEETDEDWDMEDSTESSGNSENQSHSADCNISSMDDLDLRSIASRTRTNAEIYTRLMLSCTEGLPCWRPKPLPGTKGIIPGDVGTFDLAHGFRKLFNIWEEGSEGRLYGAPPCATVQISSSHFPEGHTIANGASSSIRRSLDGQSVEQFEFDSTSEQGAVLACTSPADLIELKNLVALKRYLNQNAGAIYQQAYLMEQIEGDSLYVVTGCIKTAGWGLAAYQDATPGQVLRLTQRFDGTPSPLKGRLYDWARGVGEAWLWPNTPGEAIVNDEKAHTLFLRGFTLAFSSMFYTRLMSALQTTGMGQGEDRSYYPNTSEPSGHSRPAFGGTEYNSTSNLSPTSYLNTSLQAESGVQLSSFPDMSKATAVHPCKIITQLLLELTGADCALSHDDDWRRTFNKLSGSPSNSSNNALPLDVIASQTITVLRGVAHFEDETGGEGRKSSPSRNSQAISEKQASNMNMARLGLDQKRDKPRGGGDYTQILHNHVGGEWEDLRSIGGLHTIRLLVSGAEVGRASASKKAMAKRIICYRYLRDKGLIGWMDEEMEAILRTQP